MMACRGICIAYKAGKPYATTRYEKGQKRCSVCSMYMIWDGSSCPCCGLKLRIKPRFSKSRQRQNEIKVRIT